ncbi:MAG: MdtA/MuxA family multidrug efflux RND transporter periplasmic adaptor subunit [Thermoanaerobaculales bacterium]
MNPQPESAVPTGKAAPAFTTASATRPKPRWRLRVLALVGIGLLGSLTLLRALFGQSDAAKTSRGAAPRAVSVVGAQAHTGDLGVYQNGLGSVTPLATVTVRSRVDGQLTRVAYTEGQLVHRGDLLAEIDPRPFEVQLSQAEGQLAKDQAALANAKIDLERYQVLIQEDSIPRQQLDTQRATVDQAEAALKSDQAQVDSAKLNLIYCRITAPIAGIVGLRLVDAGNMVHASDPNGLVVITQQQPIAVVFTIAADHLPQVLKRMKAGNHLEVEAWDRDLTTKLETGTVLAIDNQIDPTTGTVRIKALFPNQGSALYANQFVNARLLVDTLRNAVLVPTAAIQRSPRSTYVFVVKSDDTVDLRDVTVELTEGDQTAIRSGLSAGETVVVDGVDKLQPGSKVALAPAGGAPKRRS